MPVLILEGDELIGAKQNRTVNSSVLVAAESELVLPVSCVERGRWSRRSGAFSLGKASPHLSLRHLKSRSVHESLRRGRGHRSDQGAVWEEVDRPAYLHEASSPTDALQDTRAGLSDKLAAFGTLSEKMPDGTRGVVVAIGAQPVDSRSWPVLAPSPRSSPSCSRGTPWRRSNATRRPRPAPRAQRNSWRVLRRRGSPTTTRPPGRRQPSAPAAASLFALVTSHRFWIPPGAISAPSPENPHNDSPQRMFIGPTSEKPLCR